MSAPGGSGRMPLFAHLDELRSRLLLALGFAAAATLLSFCLFYAELWQLLAYPLDRLREGGGPRIILSGLGPLDGFWAVTRLSVLCGLIVSAPFLLYEAWAFIRPGLRPREARLLFGACLAGGGLFALGAAVAYVFAVPAMLSWLCGFNENLVGFRDEWTAERYLGFLVMSCGGFGAAFELPLLLTALARLGLVTASGMLKNWRPAVMAIFFAAAVLTPPDPFSQIVLGTILTILYFGSYFLVRACGRNRLHLGAPGS